MQWVKLNLANRKAGRILLKALYLVLGTSRPLLEICYCLYSMYLKCDSTIRFSSKNSKMKTPKVKTHETYYNET